MRLILFTFLALALFSFSGRKPKKFIPPGTVAITENFFADEFEINNQSWQEYEFAMRYKYGYHSAQHLAALPDTLVWRNRCSYNEPYVLYYYRHPSYKDYPVVGISYEQAIAFCQWRTEKVKQFYSIRHKKDLNIEYRLPTKQEWEKLCEVPPYYLKNKGRDEKGNLNLNIVREISDTLGEVNDQIKYADVTAPVCSYKPNMLGLYQMQGNVAEMVTEKGICKGGGWQQRFEECRSGIDLPYTKPESWLGFRCVCEVK